MKDAKGRGERRLGRRFAAAFALGAAGFVVVGLTAHGLFPSVPLSWPLLSGFAALAGLGTGMAALAAAAGDGLLERFCAGWRDGLADGRGAGRSRR